MKKAGDRRVPWPARKAAARHAASLAESLGRLVRPGACGHCGEARPLTRHHPDHTAPLAVAFLCDECHRAADRRTSAGPTADGAGTSGADPC